MHRSEFCSLEENDLGFQHFAYKDACYFPERRLPEFAVVCCFSGQVDVTENQCRTILGPGEILVGNPGLLRGSRYAPESHSCEGATVIVSPQLLGQLLAEQRLAREDASVLLAGKIQSPHLTLSLRKAVQVLEERPSGFRSYLNAMLRQLLVELLWEWPHPGILSATQKEGTFISRKHFVQAMELMNRTAKCEFSVDALCQEIGMSPQNFRRLLYRSARRGPLDLYNEVLQERTEKMLARGMRPKEVAYELGFASPSQFAKFFKQNRGMTPTSYQERMCEPSPAAPRPQSLKPHSE